MLDAADLISQAQQCLNRVHSQSPRREPDRSSKARRFETRLARWLPRGLVDHCDIATDVLAVNDNKLGLGGIRPHIQGCTIAIILVHARVDEADLMTERSGDHNVKLQRVPICGQREVQALLEVLVTESAHHAVERPRLNPRW